MPMGLYLSTDFLVSCVCTVGADIDIKNMIGRKFAEDPPSSEPNLNKFGNHYRLVLSGYTCPSCTEQILTFEKNDKVKKINE